MNEIQFERLNKAAKTYLNAVRELNGRGAPGVYIKLSYNRPVWGLILGSIILLFTFIFAFGVKPGRTPLGVAMASTAGFLMGGWLVLYAIRRWMASRNSFCGKFLYFDPEHIYIGKGENIAIANLPRDYVVTPQGENQVLFSSEEGRITVPVPSRFTAQYVADYYSALAWVQRQKEGKWSDLTVPEAGAVARYLAEFDEEPGGLQDTDLELDEMPEEVYPEQRGSSGILMLLAIPVVGFAMLMVLWGMFSEVHDHEAFARAKEGGVGEMRQYLSNEKNIRHREEAEQYIRDRYDTVIKQVEAAPGTDPVLREGMVMLLKSVSGPEIPALSLRVTDGTTNPPSESTEASNLRTRFADGLGQGLGGEKKDIVLMSKPPDNTEKKPHLDISYWREGNGVLQWKVEIRKTPETKATDTGDYFVKSGSVSDPLTGGGVPGLPPFIIPPAAMGPVMPGQPQTNSRTELLYTTIMTKLIGQAPGPHAPLILDDE